MIFLDENIFPKRKIFLTILPVDLSIIIIWMSSFLVLGGSGKCFHSCIEIPVSKQCRP